jgi:hypothetical protein
MGNDIADRPDRVAVVARLEALLRRQGADEVRELVPALAFTVDLGAVQAADERDVRARSWRRHC